MDKADPSAKRLRIKKYSNRRFYDTTQSRHLTIVDMHDLIRQGYELTIHDSSSGEEITNQVLTQIILDRDPPKLEILPANILHELIRSQQQLVGNVVEQYFRQVLETQRASQQRWAAFLENTLGLKSLPGGNMDWTSLFFGRSPERTSAQAPAESPPPPPEPPPAGDEGEIRVLRQKLEELERRLGGANKSKRPKGRSGK